MFQRRTPVIVGFLSPVSNPEVSSLTLRSTPLGPGADDLTKILHEVQPSPLAPVVDLYRSTRGVRLGQRG